MPETIDAIRALTESAPDAATSMHITDTTLGMRRDFLTMPLDLCNGPASLIRSSGSLKESSIRSTAPVTSVTLCTNSPKQA